MRELDASFTRLPLPGAELVARLRERNFLHFYRNTMAGLLEVQCAPIQPTADSARTSPAQGWFVVARLWPRHVAQGENVGPAGGTEPPVAERRSDPFAPGSQERGARV